MNVPTFVQNSTPQCCRKQNIETKNLNQINRKHMQIIIENKSYSKNKYTLNEIYLILLKTQSKLQYYVCYALKYIFPFNNFCFDILFSTILRGRVLYKSRYIHDNTEYNP
jgi:hypothetical protein